jgi:hypothetical protein
MAIERSGGKGLRGIKKTGKHHDGCMGTTPRAEGIPAKGRLRSSALSFVARARV